MPTEEINLTFDAEDNPVIEVKGVAGPSCKSLTEALEKKLGTVVKDEKTREFNEREVSNAGTKVRNRS